MIQNNKPTMGVNEEKQPETPKLAQRYKFIIQEHEVPTDRPGRRKIEVIAVAHVHPAGEWMKFQDVQTVMKALAVNQINERSMYDAKIKALEKELEELKKNTGEVSKGQ